MTDERQALRRMGREVADFLGDGPSHARQQRQARDLLHAARVVRVTPRRRRARAVLIAATAVAATALVLVGGWRLWNQRRPAEMRFWRGNDLQRGKAGEWLVATPDRSLPVRFSDGSRLELVGDSTARIIEAGERRVRVGLRYGTLRARLNSGHAAQWSFAAGPFSVRDIGTDFTLAFNREEDLFELAVTEGMVSVRGPLLTEPGMSVRAGERLTVDRVERTVVKAPAEEAPSPEIEVETPPQDGDERTDGWRQESSPGGRDARAQPRRRQRGRWRAERGERSGFGSGGSPARRNSTSVEAPRSTVDNAWQPYYERGEYAEAIDAALAAGLGQLLARSRLVELWQLAEAARYAGRGREARAALIAIRVRFERSRRARVASFLLGRVAMELNDEPRAAATWFATYVREEPDGPLREEAMGRLISAHQRAGDRRAARRAARAYLDTFPEGLFASLAQSVLEASRRPD